MVSKVDKKEIPRKPGRPKGHPKTGGRQKGTSNRNSRKFLENLDIIGVNLIEEFLRAVRLLEPKEQVTEYRYLMAHAYPKLKDVEAVKEDEDTDALSEYTNEELMQMLGSKNNA